jgi:hypothetical protein
MNQNIAQLIWFEKFKSTTEYLKEKCENYIWSSLFVFPLTYRVRNPMH